MRLTKATLGASGVKSPRACSRYLFHLYHFHWFRTSAPHEFWMHNNSSLCICCFIFQSELKTTDVPADKSPTLLNAVFGHMTCLENSQLRPGVLALVVIRRCSFELVDPAPWASCQIRKIADCACAGHAGNFSPPPRVSHPDMHQRKISRHSRRMHNPQFCVSSKRSTVSLCSPFLWYHQFYIHIKYIIEYLPREISLVHINGQWGTTSDWMNLEANRERKARSNLKLKIIIYINIYFMNTYKLFSTLSNLQSNSFRIDN